MATPGQDQLKTARTLTVNGKDYRYFDLQAAERHTGSMSRLPYSLKVLLENLLRFEDGGATEIGRASCRERVFRAV